MKDDEFSFFEIDKNRLDEEWLNQPKLRFKYSHKLENARHEFEQSKAELDLVRAELDLQIRDNPDAFDMKKVTEGAIENVIIVQKEYRMAQRAMLESKHRIGVLSAAVQALDDRKRALENLVELRLADYFAEPRARSENGKHERDRIERKRAFKSVPTESNDD